MEELKFPSGSSLKLFVKISSDAIPGSNVTLDGNVIKKSGQYTFDVELGKIDDLHQSLLSAATHFFVMGPNIDPIMANTTVDYYIRSGDKKVDIEDTMLKINDNLFTAYMIVKLLKS